MPDSLLAVTQNFKGDFVADPFSIQQTLFKIKAFIFDWDGVFNSGQKDENGSSPFNEVDAMGTNLLRFNYFLRNGKNPLTAIISGEKNKAALVFAKRENFNTVYFGFKNKKVALEHFCKENDIDFQEIAFVFDDVLDFSMAALCGLRIMVSRRCNPLLNNFVMKNKLADYITANDGSAGAVRESVELLLGLSLKYDHTIEQRMNNSRTYLRYLKQRNRSKQQFYINDNSTITELKVS